MREVVDFEVEVQALRAAMECLEDVPPLTAERVLKYLTDWNKARPAPEK